MRYFTLLTSFSWYSSNEEIYTFLMTAQRLRRFSPGRCAIGWHIAKKVAVVAGKRPGATHEGEPCSGEES